MNNYQIKLIPVSNYFFGGEKHILNNTKLEADYYAKSELYPQQTSLLGLLRYYLLLINDCLNPKKIGKESEAENLIGGNSFEYGFIGENNKSEQTFGKIKSISPLYFLNRKDKYIIAPFCYGDELINQYGTFRLKSYKSKEGCSHKLVSLENSKKTVQLLEDKGNPHHDYAFIESNTVGNKKGTGGKTEDDGFYKLDMYQLNKNWAFAFDAEMDIEIKDTSLIISMGAERRMFKFEIRKQEKTNIQINELSYSLLSIFCISDCFVSEEIFDISIFAVTQNVSFRNLISKISSSNYSRFSKKNNGYRRGKRFNLMRRGSILFFKDKNALDEAIRLFKNQNAENIGFNKIQISKPYN
jgi:CRISPR-associated protein Cmr3